MRCGAAVVVVAVVTVVVVVVEGEAWEAVASLPEAQRRLRTLQARVRRIQADRHAGAALSPAPSIWGGAAVAGFLARDPGTLTSSLGKLRSLQGAVRERLKGHARLLPFGNHSIISFVFLPSAMLLLSVLGGALLRGTRARETLLPGLGLLGDAFNDLTEVVLNALTIYLYREESPDCSERLLCESSLQAGQRGLLDSLATYLSGLLVSLFLPEAPLSRSLEAMRAGRRSNDCEGLYPRCRVKL